MIVITMINCPPSLRGDLTKWLLEINPGVYVGQVSARVRERLWKRVQECAKLGRVTMVFNSNNEQHMDFRVHNSEWEPIDFDGLKLIMRPSPGRKKNLEVEQRGFSNAAKYQKAKMFSGSKQGSKYPNNYVVVSIIKGNEAHKVNALKVINNEVSCEYELDLKFEKMPEVCESFQSFLNFVGDLPLISHEAGKDYRILRAACRQFGLPLFSNRCYDTEALSRRLVKNVDDYKLGTILGALEISWPEMQDPSLQSCFVLKLLYEKLIKIGGNF